DESEGAPGEHPKIDEILSQAGAQLELDHFRQPALEDIENEQRTRDDAEYPELHEELLEIASRQRVVEGLVPAVEPNLPIGRRYDDQKDQCRQPQQWVACGGGPERFQHHADL